MMMPTIMMMMHRGGGGFFPTPESSCAQGSACMASEERVRACSVGWWPMDGFSALRSVQGWGTPRGSTKKAQTSASGGPASGSRTPLSAAAAMVLAYIPTHGIKTFFEEKKDI